MAESPVGLTSYARIGAAYGATVDEKPYNADYERPATLSLLPPLAGLRVLDMGCGNGWYAEVFVNHGAQVTAFDVSPVMAAQSQQRLGARAQVIVADLAAPLTFAATASFDLAVAALALHYVAEWTPVLREVHRVLRPGGLLVFSTHHPTADYQRHPDGSYFDVELVTEEWQDLGMVQFYRRPLTAIAGALAAAGFVVERLLEPLPTAEFAARRPEAYARLLRFPAFLMVRARAE